MGGMMLNVHACETTLSTYVQKMSLTQRLNVIRLSDVPVDLVNLTCRRQCSSKC